MARPVIMRRHPQLRQIAIQNISRIAVFIRRISTIIDLHHQLLPRRIAPQTPGLHLRKIICRQLLLRLHLTRFPVKNRQHIPHYRNHLRLSIAIHISGNKIIAPMRAVRIRPPMRLAHLPQLIALLVNRRNAEQMPFLVRIPSPLNIEIRLQLPRTLPQQKLQLPIAIHIRHNHLPANTFHIQFPQQPRIALCITHS